MQQISSFVIRGRLPGLNELIASAKGSGGTGASYSRLKKKLTNDLALQILAQKVPKFDGAVSLEFEYFEKDKRRDPDNISAGARKVILDSLVHAKRLSGDGWKNIAAFYEHFDIDAVYPRIVVTITPAQP